MKILTNSVQNKKLNKYYTTTGVFEAEKYNSSWILHREDGPAIEYANGYKEWWIDDKRHREDGPAVENQYLKQWWVNNKLHRLDGPAIEWASGTKEWYIDGKKYSEEGFNAEIQRRKNFDQLSTKQKTK